jgi:RNA polymerase sigma-70 factor (ECF subfamily)
MNAEGTNFETIYAEFRPRILRYLTRIVGEFDAEDLTQEVFLRVNKGLAGFRGESQLSTWIYRIATNVAFDRMRTPDYQKITESGLSIEDVLDNAQDGDQTIWVGEQLAPPEQQIHYQEELTCFCHFLESLPESYRFVLILSELEAKTVKEIAMILDLDENVVKIRLHRGRVRLIQELKNYCKPEDWL